MRGYQVNDEIGAVDRWLDEVEGYEDQQEVEIPVGLVRWLYVSLSEPQWAEAVLSRKVSRAIEDKHST